MTPPLRRLNTGSSIGASNRSSGSVVRGGVEWALRGNWSAKFDMTFSNWMTSRLERGLPGRYLHGEPRDTECSEFVSTIGSGRFFGGGNGDSY